MQDITHTYLSRAETWLLITTLVYFLLNGAQLFETAVVVPQWSANPPESFQLLQGRYGLDLKTFWIVFHSIHELTFIIAIIFCWRLEIRNWLLLLFAVHFLVRVWTLAYFAPGIIGFQQMTPSVTPGQNLVAATSLWKNLNYVRVAIFVAVSVALVPLCMKVMAMKTAAGTPD